MSKLASEAAVSTTVSEESATPQSAPENAPERVEAPQTTIDEDPRFRAEREKVARFLKARDEAKAEAEAAKKELLREKVARKLQESLGIGRDIADDLAAIAPADDEGFTAFSERWGTRLKDHATKTQEKPVTTEVRTLMTLPAPGSRVTPSTQTPGEAVREAIRNRFGK